MMSLKITRKSSDARGDAKMSDDHVSYVTLADGQVVAVPHANLAGAKELLALRKAALRRVEAARAPAQTRITAVEWERVGELELVS